MRNYLVAAVSIIILASCSTSRKMHRDFSTAQSSNAGKASSGGARNVDNYPLHTSALLYPTLYTSSRSNVILPIDNKSVTRPKDTVESNDQLVAEVSARRRQKELSKTQRKEFRKAMRDSMRRYVVPGSKKSTKRSDLNS